MEPSSKEINHKSPKFKIAVIARISRYKFFFLQKTMFHIGPKTLFVIKTVKSTVPWRYVIIDLNGYEIRGRPCEKVLQRRVYS